MSDFDLEEEVFRFVRHPPVEMLRGSAAARERVVRALLQRAYDAGLRRGVEDAAETIERCLRSLRSVLGDDDETVAVLDGYPDVIRALLDPKPDPDQGPGDPLVSEMLRGSGEMRPFDFDHEATKAWAAACKLMEANGEDPERMVREATKGLSDWQGVQTSEEMPEHFEREPRGPTTSTPPQPAEIVEADAGRAPAAIAALEEVIEMAVETRDGIGDGRSLDCALESLRNAVVRHVDDAEGSES